MKTVFLLIATAVAAGLQAVAPYSPFAACTGPAACTGKCMVSDYLITTGFTESCILQFFDICAPPELTPPKELTDTLMKVRMVMAVVKTHALTRLT